MKCESTHLRILFCQSFLPHYLPNAFSFQAIFLLHPPHSFETIFPPKATSISFIFFSVCVLFFFPQKVLERILKLVCIVTWFSLLLNVILSFEVIQWLRVIDTVGSEVKCQLFSLWQIMTVHLSLLIHKVEGVILTLS